MRQAIRRDDDPIRMPRWTLAGASVLLLVTLAACAPEPAPPTAGSASPSADATSTPDASATPTGSPTPTVEPVATVPTDCRAILSPAVLAQLKDVPLNDPAFGKSGVQADGSLVCVWGSPQADTTGLSTTISRTSRERALDVMNGLRSEGYTCYTPSGGTRCEKTWTDPTYPVIDGRTLFWRAGVLIDTRYSNLAPSGYTDSIVTHIYG